VIGEAEGGGYGCVRIRERRERISLELSWS